jgi:hypothetical protein
MAVYSQNMECAVKNKERESLTQVCVMLNLTSWKYASLFQFKLIQETFPRSMAGTYTHICITAYME